MNKNQALRYQLHQPIGYIDIEVSRDPVVNGWYRISLYGLKNASIGPGGVGFNIPEWGLHLLQKILVEALKPEEEVKCL